MKALITLKYDSDEYKVLKDLGYELIYMDERDIQFSENIKDIDLMVCFNIFDKVDINLFPNLKWIQLLSAGINHIPLKTVKDRNILLTNNRGGYSVPIAEWIVLKTLEMIKNSKEFYEKQSKKLWKMDTSLLELYGKTVGFIGTGSIAQETAKRLAPFGVKIIGINSKGRNTKYFDESYAVSKLNYVVAQSDFIIVTTPYTDATHHLIDKDVLSNFKNDSYLVNIARGSIIDEEALIHALENKKIKKAALDVFEIEPLPLNSKLWEMDNVIISPHNSWASEMTHKRRFNIAYENMTRFIKNEELVNLIDIELGY